MSEPRRLSQRTHAVLARNLLQEKAERAAAKKANRRPAAATESTNEEPVFAEMAAMDEPTYQERLLNIARLVNMVDVAITDYGEADVEIHDVQNEEYKEQLGKTREKYEHASQEICNVIADLKESELDERRKQELVNKQKDLTTRMKENASKVRRKAAELSSAAALEVAATGAASAETAKKKERRRLVGRPMI